jgi:hypothetical protein
MATPPLLWQSLAVRIIGSPDPSGQHLAVETAERVKAAGLPPPIIIPGVLRHENAHDVGNMPIERAHLKVISTFVRGGFAKTKHLMVCEDDCSFGDGEDVAGTIERALATLDNTVPWSSLHVGHVPIGPTFPLFTLGGTTVVWSSVPYCGHCYILNKVTAMEIAAKPAHAWVRPRSHEGMFGVPLLTKFALHPPLATQNRRPKELSMIDVEKPWLFTKGYDFNDLNHLFGSFAIFLPPIIFFLLYRIINSVLARWRPRPPTLSAPS